nr:copia protein [Tanacetum cinerariifolium]
MNYVPVVSGINSTNLSGIKDAASQEEKKDVSSLRYIALPNWVHDALMESSSCKPQDDCVETPIPTISSPVPTACFTDSQEPSSNTRIISKRVANQVETPSMDNILTLTNRFEDILGVTTNSDESNGVEADTLVDCPKEVRPIGTKWVLKNKKDERGIVIKNKAKLVAQGDTQEEWIDYDELFAPVARIEAVRLFLAYASFIGFTVYKMDVKSAFLYGTIDEEVEFEALMHEKFQMSAMGELNFFLGLQVLQKEDGIFLSQDNVKFSHYWDNFLLLVFSLGFGLTFAGTSKYWGVLRILMISLRLIPLIEHNVDFHPIVDFVEASHLRIETTEEGTKILSTIDSNLRTISESSIRRNPKLNDEAGISSLPDAELFENLTLMGYNISPNQKFTFQKGTPTEPHHIPSPEAQQTSSTTHSSPTLPPVTTALIPTVTPSYTPHLRHYTKRPRIAQSSALPPVADEPASPLRDVSQGEACPTVSSLDAEQDRENIAKTSTLPYESTSRVLSLAANEGSLQQSDLVSKFEAQEFKITMLKARVKLLEDREGRVAERSGDDAPIKGRSLDEGEEVVEKGSNNTEEMINVLTSMDAAIVLSSRVAKVPTGSSSIPTAGSPATGVPTGSDVVPTAGPIFATATVVTPYTRRKRKEKMIEMNEQIAKDAKIARIHAEEELQIMIDGLDRSNETIATYLQEYHQFATELPIERRIELISDLVRYQDNYAKVHKYHTLQRKPRSKKQKKDYYMAVIKGHAGWKTKDFKGMSFKQIEAKFNTVWKQIEDFIPMGSKKETERFKRKGFRLEQVSEKKLKTSEEVLEEVKATEEVPKDKVKEMMQLVPIEEVYVEALEVKHPIIDWKVYTEGQRSYWKITRLGGSSTSYQFFVDMLKHLDREDLNQLWRLVKETLSIWPPTSDKDMKLWVELKRLDEPDDEDQLWTHT